MKPIDQIRDELAEAILQFVFEPNDAATRMQAQLALSSVLAEADAFDYLVICDHTNNTEQRVPANEMRADIAIQSAQGAEFLYVPVYVAQVGVTA